MLWQVNGFLFLVQSVVGQRLLVDLTGELEHKFVANSLDRDKVLYVFAFFPF